MRRSRKVKILATLGPASSEKAKIRSLFEAGADVFRINMSHTDHARLREMVGIIREVEADCGRPIGILVDLQGPKAQDRHLRRARDHARARPHLHPRLRSEPRRRRAGRTPPSRDLRGAGARPSPPSRRRQDPPARDGMLEDAGGYHRRGRHAPVRPQGRQHPRFDHRLRRADGQGPLRPRGRAERRHRLDRALLHPAPGGLGARSEDGPRPCRRARQDREAARRSSTLPRSSNMPTR